MDDTAHPEKLVGESIPYFASAANLELDLKTGRKTTKKKLELLEIGKPRKGT